MLDYKDIVTKHFALGMSGSKIAEYLKVSKSGVNDFLRAFKECEKIGYPLPEGITNYGIAEIVYGRATGSGSRDLSYELPDFADVHKLTDILRKLSEGGNTVVVIEHNLDVIKVADYIIDIGPEGGDGGGTVIAKGTPEEVAKNKKSYTGQWIKKKLEK